MGIKAVIVDCVSFSRLCVLAPVSVNDSRRSMQSAVARRMMRCRDDVIRRAGAVMDRCRGRGGNERTFATATNLSSSKTISRHYQLAHVSPTSMAHYRATLCKTRCMLRQFCLSLRLSHTWMVSFLKTFYYNFAHDNISPNKCHTMATIKVTF